MSSREGQMHDENGRGLWGRERLWSPATYTSICFLIFVTGDEERLIRWSALSSFCAKSPIFARKSKEWVHCPMPNTSVTKIPITRNAPSPSPDKVQGNGGAPLPYSPSVGTEPGVGVRLSCPGRLKTSLCTTISFASTSAPTSAPPSPQHRVKGS